MILHIKQTAFSFSGFTVTYTQDTYVPLGSSVVLPCQVDKSLLKKSLKVEWRRTETDSETLVHLYEDGAEKQQQDYQDRAHFFTEEIKHGNFSLRLDNLRAGDEGEYTCTVHGGSPQNRRTFSTKIKVLLRLLGESTEKKRATLLSFISVQLFIILCFIHS